jgi:signal peptidase I
MSTPELGSSDSVPSAPEITPEKRNEALRQVNRRSPIGFFWEWIKIVFVAMVVFLVIRTFLVEAFKIPSGSMEHTLLVGDFLLVNKLAYGAEVPFTHQHLPKITSPKIGDVIVFDYPRDLTKNFVKRLVGMPGDTVEMHDGVLFRNGKQVPENYIEHSDQDFDSPEDEFYWQRDYLVHRAGAVDNAYHPSRNNWGPLIVPQKSYFVLGDNRDNSLDSRYWGFVADSLVKGRPFVIYYSYAPDTVDRFAWLTHIRWNRLGELIR